MRLFLVILLFCMAAGGSRADDASRLVLAKRLVDQVHLKDVMTSAMPMMAAQMKSTLAQQGHTDADADMLVKLYQQRVTAKMGHYTDLMADAYAKAFTEDELTGIIAFDDTPLGRKLIAETPALVQASALAAHEVAQDAAREVLDEMQKRKDEDAQHRKM